MRTVYDQNIDDALILNYLDALVNRFFKILPIKESGEDTLQQYLESLLREMTGFNCLVSFVAYDDRYLTLLSMLQYLIERDVDVDVVRTEVFRAIGIIKKIRQKYCENAR